MKNEKSHLEFPVIIYDSGLAETGTGQCDCACPATVDHVLSQNIPESAKVRTNPKIYLIPLDNEYTTLSGDTIRPMVINNSAKCLLSDLIRPRSLRNLQRELCNLWGKDQVRPILAKLLDLRLIVPLDYSDALSQVKSNLIAWLHLTDRCNLRCAYCYLPHVREDMSPETGHAAVDAIFRSALLNGIQEVKLKYAGGEPLLRFSLILELQQYAASLAEQHELSLSSTVLSNGTLLNTEHISAMKNEQIRLMISLDGLSTFHDRHRPYAGGRGSFAEVAQAIELALAHNLIPDISITVSGRTIDGIPELMTWILERDLPFSLNFYRENELSVSYEDLRLDNEKIINGLRATFKVIEANLPKRSLLPSLIDRANLVETHTHTCGVGQNYLVFDQNGQVAKCQMHIHNSITNINAKDVLGLIRADQIGIRNLPVEEKEGCRECEWRFWCTGGCPLATFRATGRYDVKSPNCSIYKTLFPEAVRLEGLRLLKYADVI